MLRGFGGQAEATRARARQGAVLFVALLILLWVPLLIFSSSAIRLGPMHNCSVPAQPASFDIKTPVRRNVVANAPAGFLDS